MATKRPWGVWDIEDRLWIGNDSGPVTFEDESLAKIAAMVACVRLGWPIVRCRAKKFQASQARLRDELPTRMGSEEAIRKLEGGQV